MILYTNGLQKMMSCWSTGRSQSGISIFPCNPYFSEHQRIRHLSNFFFFNASREQRRIYWTFSNGLDLFLFNLISWQSHLWSLLTEIQWTHLLAMLKYVMLWNLFPNTIHIDYWNVIPSYRYTYCSFQIKVEYKIF